MIMLRFFDVAMLTHTTTQYSAQKMHIVVVPQHHSYSIYYLICINVKQFVQNVLLPTLIYTVLTRMYCDHTCYSWSGRFTSKKDRIKNTNITKHNKKSLDNIHKRLSSLPLSQWSVLNNQIVLFSHTNHDRLNDTVKDNAENWLTRPIAHTVSDNVSSLAGICKVSVLKT